MNKEKNKIVIFDFDGVIVDSFDCAYKTASMNILDLTKEDYKSFFEGNINNAKFVKKSDDFDFFKYYLPELLKLSPVEGIGILIQRLSSQYKLVIISSSINKVIEDFLSQNDLKKNFDLILGNDISKSKIDKFKIAMDHFQVTAEDCVFITDTLGDLREAESVGVPSIADTWGYHDIDRLNKGESVAVVDSVQVLEGEIKKYFDK